MNRLSSIVALACCCLVPAAAGIGQNRPTAQCLKPKPGRFLVFDALGYEGKPDLAQIGFDEIFWFDRDFWVDGSNMTAADPAKVRRLIAAIPPGKAPLVIDIEHLDLTSNPRIARANADRLVKITRIFKAAAPNRPVGLYGLIPTAFDPAWGAEQAAIWRRANDTINILEREVDALFPSLYTNSTDARAWTRLARETVCEARRLSRKPVYPFIGPDFHEGSKYKNKPLPAELWDTELTTLSQIADGAVVWGGWDFDAWKLKRWDEREGWWGATRTRMAHLRKHGRPRPPR